VVPLGGGLKLEAGEASSCLERQLGVVVKTSSFPKQDGPGLVRLCALVDWALACPVVMPQIKTLHATILRHQATTTTTHHAPEPPKVEDESADVKTRVKRSRVTVA